MIFIRRHQARELGIASFVVVATQVHETASKYLDRVWMKGITFWIDNYQLWDRFRSTVPRGQ